MTDLDPDLTITTIRRRIERGLDTTIPPDITPRQVDVLNFCREKVKGSGRMPTVREVQAKMGFLSLSSAQYHLDVLRERDLLIEQKDRQFVTLPEAKLLLDALDAMATFGRWR